MSPQLSTEADVEEVQEALKEFLSKYKYLYEIRFQKLVYEAELYCIENYGARLTTAEFKPYIYGSYSETIRKALNDLDVKKDVVYRNGGKTTKYLGYGVSGGDLPDAKKKIIERVHQRTKRTSTEELAEESKASWLYQNQDYDNPMNFEEYYEQLGELEDRPRYDEQRPVLGGQESTETADGTQGESEDDSSTAQISSDAAQSARLIRLNVEDSDTFQAETTS